MIPTFLYNVDEDNKKGIVIICHGFSEYSALYKEITDVFWAAGYTCVVFDQRGHGAPPEGVKKWHGLIPDYQCFIDDVVSVTETIKQIAPGTPVILYGYSIGASIVINTLLRLPAEKVKDYKCAVLEAPWLGFFRKPNLLKINLVKLLTFIAPNYTVTTKRYLNDPSGTFEYTKAFLGDPLYHCKISLRMLTGIYNAGNYAVKNANKYSVPTLLAYGKKDRVVNKEAIMQFAADAHEMVKLKGYDSKHTIHDELRELFCRDIIEFMDFHCDLS